MLEKIPPLWGLGLNARLHKLRQFRLPPHGQCQKRSQLHFFFLSALCIRGNCAAVDMCPHSRQKLARSSLCRHLCVWVSPNGWAEDDCCVFRVICSMTIPWALHPADTDIYSPTLIRWPTHLPSIARLQRAISNLEKEETQL